MRLRKKPWIDTAIHEFHDFVFPKDYDFEELQKNTWQKIFQNDFPLALELGTGKGSFLCEIARQNPKQNFIGIEKSQDIIYQAAQKIREAELLNVRLLVYDAGDLESIFSLHEVSAIYLNFSDPWPKARHAKRRLTHRNFLKIYQKILKPHGTIFLKTDNFALFEFSLLEFQEMGLDVKNISYDLYADGARDNIRTEYEDKFLKLGAKIHACQVIFP